MNPSFWLIGLIALAVLYLCAAFVFPLIGSVAVKIFDDFKNIVFEKSDSKDSNH